ncbi:MAG TPA: hypothetical protein VNK81_02345 [Thermodesulfobacteriota bacterium]|jgi:hypothetical protein|nr:hypothetical protein [Thermodesulfobacteriota bacterium]
MERRGSFSGLEEDLEFLKRMGIDVIVNLEEFRDYTGFEVKRIPIGDFRTPRSEDFIAR